MKIEIRQYDGDVKYEYLGYGIIERGDIINNTEIGESFLICRTELDDSITQFIFDNPFEAIKLHFPDYSKKEIVIDDIIAEIEGDSVKYLLFTSCFEEKILNLKKNRCPTEIKTIAEEYERTMSRCDDKYIANYITNSNSGIKIDTVIPESEIAKDKVKHYQEHGWFISNKRKITNDPNNFIKDKILNLSNNYTWEQKHQFQIDLDTLEEEREVLFLDYRSASIFTKMSKELGIEVDYTFIDTGVLVFMKEKSFWSKIFRI